MSNKTPIIFREAGIDPTQDEIPLRRASMRPLIGCGVLLIVGCIVSFALVAGLSYANGRRAAEAAVMIETEMTSEATAEVTAEMTSEATAEVTAEMTDEPTPMPSATITDTPTVIYEFTDEPPAPVSQNSGPSGSTSNTQPRTVTRYIQDTVYVTVPPRVVTREIIIEQPPDVLIVTATPTALPSPTPSPTQPEVTAEITPEVTAEITDEASPSPTASPTLTDTPTLTETATLTATATPTATSTLTETPTLTLAATSESTEEPLIAETPWGEPTYLPPVMITIDPPVTKTAATPTPLPPGYYEDEP